MTDSAPKPKLRWWQFSLGKFFVLLTVGTVLVMGFYRLRVRGHELVQTRFELALDSTLLQKGPVAWRERMAEFDSWHWLPLKVYELTSNYDLDAIGIYEPRAKN